VDKDKRSNLAGRDSSAIKYLLLGLLCHKPRSGYALHKACFKPNRPNPSQIYRSLAKLLQNQLVNFCRREQDKLPDQKVYHVTKAGETYFYRWLRKPLAARAIRDPFLIQLWFSSYIEKGDVIRNIRGYAKSLRDQAQWYNVRGMKLLEQMSNGAPGPTRELYWRMGIDWNKRQIEAFLDWADAAIQELSSLGFEDVESSENE